MQKEKQYNSPLLLMEISIERSNQTYKIVGEGDLFANPDLPHALEAETKDKLPCISEHLNSKKGFSLNSYLDELKKDSMRYQNGKSETVLQLKFLNHGAFLFQKFSCRL